MIMNLIFFWKKKIEKKNIYIILENFKYQSF